MDNCVINKVCKKTGRIRYFLKYIMLSTTIFLIVFLNEQQGLKN